MVCGEGMDLSTAIAVSLQEQVTARHLMTETEILRANSSAVQTATFSWICVELFSFTAAEQPAHWFQIPHTLL